MGLKQEIDVARADVNDDYGVTLAVRDAEPGGVEVQLDMSPTEAKALAVELQLAAGHAEHYLQELREALAPRAPMPEEKSLWR